MDTATVYIDLAMRGNNGQYPDLPDEGWIPWLTDERVMGVALFALNGVPSEWSHTNLLAMGEGGQVLVHPMFDLLAEYPHDNLN